MHAKQNNALAVCRPCCLLLLWSALVSIVRVLPNISLKTIWGPIEYLFAICVCPNGEILRDRTFEVSSFPRIALTRYDHVAKQHGLA